MVMLLLSLFHPYDHQTVRKTRSSAQAEREAAASYPNGEEIQEMHQR